MNDDKSRLDWLEKHGGYTWGSENQEAGKEHACRCVDFSWVKESTLREAIDARINYQCKGGRGW